jgi:hypothetical protein
MKKIRLDLEALDVVSFTTDGDPDAPRGTVRGQDSYTYGGYLSCQGLCNTNEYDTCREAGPSVGPSCDWDCAAASVGC